MEILWYYILGDSCWQHRQYSLVYSVQIHTVYLFSAMIWACFICFMSVGKGGGEVFEATQGK